MVKDMLALAPITVCGDYAHLDDYILDDRLEAVDKLDKEVDANLTRAGAFR